MSFIILPIMKLIYSSHFNCLSNVLESSFVLKTTGTFRGNESSNCHAILDELVFEVFQLSV